jgi:murein DD-endopeptidase MepM/ murein hydrolase activator NlpD
LAVRITDLLAPLLAIAVTTACKPKPVIDAPLRAERLAPASATLADADVLVRAFAKADTTALRQWMTPELRGRLDAQSLSEAMAHLKDEFGEVQGLLEDRTHHEGSLLWYSGLWVHRKDGKRPQLTSVLYQFALDDKRRLARLLVREHWFLETLDPPADRYVPVTRLHFPGAGTWTISHGGRSSDTNHHFDTRVQRFAYDIIVKRGGRRRDPNAPASDNRAYYCYGREVLAPAAGTVIVAINDVAENIPGQGGGSKGGNGVVIDHGFGEYSSLWHGIPGTVKVKEGDQVSPGQLLMLAGNSGHSSGPHLHYHLSTRDFGGNADFGLPAPFVDVWQGSRWHAQFEPSRGDEISNDPPKGVARRDQARGPRVLVDL